jgi:TonB family protein
MKKLAAWSRILPITVLVALAAHADNGEKQQQASILLANAAIANLRSKNSPGFHVRMEVHVSHLGPKESDGSYEETWRSADAWRREISFPGFVQREVGDSEGRWLARNIDFRPHAIYLLSRAVETSMEPFLRPGEQGKRVFDRKKDGVDLHCAELKWTTTTWERTLCFDPRGPLANVDDRTVRLEYLDFQKFGEKLYPRHLKVYQNGEQALDVRVTELSFLPDAAPAHFDHVDGARLMAVCSRWEAGVPAKKVAPQYPSEARNAGMQGTVTLYVALAGDGSVDKLKVLESAGMPLDNASINAVKQWVYAPETCGPKPLPTEIEVQVNFELRRG